MFNIGKKPKPNESWAEPDVPKTSLFKRRTSGPEQGAEDSPVPAGNNPPAVEAQPGSRLDRLFGRKSVKAANPDAPPSPEDGPSAAAASSGWLKGILAKKGPAKSPEKEAAVPPAEGAAPEPAPARKLFGFGKPQDDVKPETEAGEGAPAGLEKTAGDPIREQLQDEAAAATTLKKTFGGLFGKRQERVNPEAEDSKTKPVGRSFLSFFTKKPKLALTVEFGETIRHWAIESDGTLSDLESPGKLDCIRISGQDIRFSAEKSLSDGQCATNAGLPAIVNLTKELGSFYASEEGNSKCTPCGALLERVLSDTGQGSRAIAAIFDRKSGGVVAALYENYVLKAVIVSNEPAGSALTQFSNSTEARQVVPVSGPDLLKRHGKSAYRRIRIKDSGQDSGVITLNSGILPVAALLLAGTAAFVTLNTWALLKQIPELSKAAAASVAAGKAEEAAKATVVLQSLKGKAVPVDRAIARAERMWKPGLKIRLSAEGTKSTYVVSGLTAQDAASFSPEQGCQLMKGAENGTVAVVCEDGSAGLPGGSSR